LFDLLLFLERLGYCDRLRNLVPFFGLLSGLSLGCVHGVGHGGVACVYRDVLEAASVCLETHMKRNRVAVGILPVGDACRNFVLSNISRCELARRRPHDDRRSSVWNSWNLFVLVARWSQRVLDHVRNLNDALHSRCRVRSRRVPDECVLLDLFQGSRAEEGWVTLLSNLLAKGCGCLLEIFQTLLLSRSTQI